MKENSKNNIQHGKVDCINILIKAIETQTLPQHSKNIILQMLKQNYLLGPVEYTYDLLLLIFPFLQIKQYQQSMVLQPFSQQLQFRRLLSGEVYEFQKKTVEKPLRRLKSLIHSRSSIKAFQRKHSVTFIESTGVLFKSLQNPQTYYVTKTQCKILILQLNQQSKQVMNTSFDLMKSFFHKHYQILFRNKVQMLRCLQYFQRDNKKYKQAMNITNGLYFIDQGILQVTINDKNCSLQLRTGSIIGAQKYFNLYDKYTYKVKSGKLSSYFIKSSHLVKLGENWLKFLQEYAYQQDRLRKQYIDSQRQPLQAEKINKISLIKSRYQQRNRTSSTNQNNLQSVLQKMYELEEGIVMNYQISQDFKKQLPKIQRYTLSSWDFKKRSLTSKFNPYKCLEKYSKRQSKLNQKRRGFEQYIRIPSSNLTSKCHSPPQKQLNKQNSIELTKPKSLKKSRILSINYYN